MICWLGCLGTGLSGKYGANSVLTDVHSFIVIAESDSRSGIPPDARQRYEMVFDANHVDGFMEGT